jgi:hypothetical protein
MGFISNPKRSNDQTRVTIRRGKDKIYEWEGVQYQEQEEEEEEGEKEKKRRDK